MYPRGTPELLEKLNSFDVRNTLGLRSAAVCATMLATIYIVTIIVAPGLRRLTGGGLFMTFHRKLQYLLNMARSRYNDRGGHG